MRNKRKTPPPPLPRDGKRSYWGEHLIDSWIHARIQNKDPMAAPVPEPEHPKLITQKEVVSRTGLSKVTIWRLEHVGRFPPRIRLGGETAA